MAVCRGMDVFDEIVPERIVHQRREFIDFGVGHFGDEVFGGAGALKADIAVHLSDSGIRHPADRDQRFTGQLQVAEWIVHTDGDDRCVRIQFPDACDDGVPVFLKHLLTIVERIGHFCQHQRGNTKRFRCGEYIASQLTEAAESIELIGNWADDARIRDLFHVCADTDECIGQRVVRADVDGDKIGVCHAFLKLRALCDQICTADAREGLQHEVAVFVARIGWIKQAAQLHGACAAPGERVVGV